MTMRTVLGTHSSRHTAHLPVGGEARPRHITERSGPAASPGSRAIYLPAEIASYLRAASPVATWVLAPRQVYGWIRRGLLAPAVRNAPESSIVADFDDLVTGQAISLLRAAGISLRAIERAEAFFTDLYGIGRPFTHRSF